MGREGGQKLKRGFPFPGLSKYTVYLQSYPEENYLDPQHFTLDFDPRQKSTIYSSK